VEIDMDLFDAIKTRRSVRRFVGDPVPAADLKRIVSAGIEAPSGLNGQLRQYVIVDSPAVLEQMKPASAVFKTAPAAIVLLIEPKETRGLSFWVQDASAAMENMLLAAAALGYGACWIEGEVHKNHDLLQKVLEVPQHLRVWAIVAVGKAAETPPRPAKSQYADVVHHNLFTPR